ncbi:TIR domain-containing protein [Pseudoflavitalea sp. X16]|uniref:COR domain-containing protein n=1 Tax=Paraflavitalea devenefica TaxID=2716334 RepID=UPI00141FDD08|nr:COR domain-containing protein [Paraflavitalea devenefica]NII28753.1 TIR domain-containing protein [Paraflavitalea devenefica]
MSNQALELIHKCYENKSTELDLGNCGLTNEDFIEGDLIDTELRKCKHLQSLVLSNKWWNYRLNKWVYSKNQGDANRLTVAPSCLADLIEISTLICAGDGNREWSIRSLSDTYNFKKLSYLNLSNNKIKEISWIRQLSSLQELDLSNNNITDISPLKELTSLEDLYLSGNQIRNAQSLSDLSSLKKLHLNANLLSNVVGLESLTAIQELDLSSNQIQYLNGLEQLRALCELNLSLNQISAIKEITNLTELKKLNLNGNKITHLEGIERLINLQQLNLSSNRIQNIKQLLTFLQRGNTPMSIVLDKVWKTNYGDINISDNPLTTPPVEIVKQGNKSIVHYFTEMHSQGVEYLYEAKMLIVGEPRAGKTSLRFKLVDRYAALPEEEETTRGIDIQRIGFNIMDKEGQSRMFYYNVWDFGGQQIYQTTHQFFLTHRSLYVLVMDTGKDSVGNNDSTINYWLQAVELLGGNSPLFLVRNEKNGRQVNIDFPQKKIRFSFLKNDYKLDLNALIPSHAAYKEDKEKEFNRFKEDVENEIKRLPLVGFPLPRNWMNIRTELQEKGKRTPYISRQDYSALCSRFEVTDFEKQMELSRIFHDLGVFLHFQDYGSLEDFIILQNVWATDAVFAVLDNTEVKDKKGRFKDEDLPKIWEHKGYRKDVHKKLLALMMKFELCYEIDNIKNAVYIVPEMLPDTFPKGYTWHLRTDLFLQYRYDFMPRGLLTRLIVRLHKHIDLQNNEQLVWKTGVKINGNGLDCPSTIAEILESWDNKQISIRVHGPFSKELMHKITFQIDTLNNDFFKRLESEEHVYKSRYYKMVPCNCITCKGTEDTHFYDYSELLERKEFGKNTIECKKRPFSAININELLDGVLFFGRPLDQSQSRLNAGNGKKMFISYSKEDLPLVNKFIEHLSPLQQDGKVAHWYCTELTAGSDWHDVIQEHFEQSDIVCFMVSPNFMKTKYIQEYEIKKAFERQAKDPAFKIVPIILDFCQWTTVRNNLGQFTALPYTAKPVVDFSNQNMAWYIIQECLRMMIEKDLHPTGEDFYTSQALPKDVLKLLERIVAGKADA